MYKKVFSAAILASAAMAMTSCSSSKNAQNENVTKAEKITEKEDDLRFESAFESLLCGILSHDLK